MQCSQLKGPMANKRTEEKSGVGCPFCHAGDECSHLLAMIDIHFNDWSAGYASEHRNECRTAIEDAFRPLLQVEDEAERSWSDEDIADLWSGALDSYSPGDADISLDSDALTRLLIRILKDEGAAERLSADDIGAPGFSSTISVLYAKRAKTTFEKGLSRLKLMLKTAR